MAKFKRKIKSSKFEDKKNTQGSNNKNKKQFLYIVSIIVLIVVIFSIGFAYKRKTDSSQSYIQAVGEVKIIDSSGQSQPNVPVGEEKADNVHSPANPESPATIEDLGGNSGAPGNIDKLLEDKNIEVDGQNGQK